MRQLRRATGRAVDKLAAPQLTHTRLVDERLLAAVEQLHVEHHEGLVEQRATRAELMAELRRMRTALKDAQTRVQALELKAHHELDHHLLEHRTLPHMAPEHELSVVAHNVLGQVLGFDGGGSGVAPEERYRAFEDAFRGTEERVADLLCRYVDLVEGHAPVLDAGCGRGELLALLRERGIDAIGVDLDAGMVAAARQKGHDVVERDINGYLEERPAGSLGAIVATEVIEHLAYEELMRFLDLAHAALRPGGVLLLETVNPHNVPALKGFWLDPTHQHPLFPEVVLTLCRAVGFASGYAFHPTGEGDVGVDRYREPIFAVLATKAAPDGDAG